MERNQFGVLSELQPEVPDTWQDRLFLTFDVDWACDAVLADTIDLVEAADVAATWFITHDTPLLTRLRSNPSFELGIHPNFNFLLAGDIRNGASAGDVVDRMLDIVPSARVVRSHSMTQSSPLLQMFLERGMTHDCNHFVPVEAGVTLRPWRHWNGLIKAPYFWEDDVRCHLQSDDLIEDVARKPGLRIFDFHPIHVFLNTEHADRYERTRALHHDAPALFAHRSADARGSRALLKNLLEMS